MQLTAVNNILYTAQIPTDHTRVRAHTRTHTHTQECRQIFTEVCTYNSDRFVSH